MVALTLGAWIAAAPAAYANDLLADYEALAAAEAKAKAGDTEGALKALGGVQPRPACDAAPDLMYARAALLAAELLSTSDPAASAERLLALPPDGARLKTAAERLRKAKKEAAALDAERRLLIEAAESAEAIALADRLGAAGVVKRLGTPERRMARIRRLFESHVNDRTNSEALALSQTIGKKHALSCELAYITGKSARKLRRYRPAIATLAIARKVCHEAKSENFARRSALLEIRVRGIRGELKGTTRVAKWLEAQYPGHSYVDDAWFVVAEVHGRRGKPGEAKAIYERITKMKGADHATLAAWRLAFDDIKAGKNEAAAKRLAWIAEQDVPRDVEHARAHYWRSRLTDGAIPDALAKRPSFYTWLALDRLRKRDPKAAKAFEARILAASKPAHAKLPVLTGPQADRAKALFERDEPQLAEAELARLECAEKMPATEAVALAAAYHEIGAYPAAQLVLRTKDGLLDELDPKSAPVWRLAYSRPYEPQIAKAAKKAKLEKWFLMGLVREESTFDPEIVSWAGAVGLAQLMPPTAIGAYAEVYGGRLDLARLTEPELNLRLGGHVLAQGYRWFKSEPLALAAYNGGPGLTKRALPKKPTPFDLWVETIPVKETRRYVKRVTETWGLYRLFYADERFVDLPDTIRPAS